MKRNDLGLVSSLAIFLSSVAGSALAQDDRVIDLGTVLLRGDKVGRVSDDASTGISVLSGAEVNLPANSDIDDVINTQANVLANEGFKPPAIRGVDGMGGDRPAITAGAQPRIPILIDDVPIPSGEASNITQTSVWDVDTVEVARGPQATSNGRNTLGGAIRVYTNDPTFFYEGAARLSYTDQSETGLAFMANTPIIEDQLALRFTGEFTDGESYITNPDPLPGSFDANEETSQRLRAKLLWEPVSVPGLSMVLSAEKSDIVGPTEGFFNGDIDDLALDGIFTFSSAYEDVEQTTYSARLTYDIGDSATVVARVSRLDSDLRFLDSGEEIFPGATLGETGFQKEMTEAEIYVQFADVGMVNRGVFGVIRSVEDEEGYNNGAALAFDLEGKIENTGIYAELEFDGAALAPGLAFIAGGRYEIDDRARTSRDGTGTLVGTGDFEEEVFLPKLGLRYDMSDLTSVGYTYSEGFRGGGLDVDLAAPFGGAAYSAAVFSPERLKQHEIYGRADDVAGILDLKASAFYYTWEDAHVSGSATYPDSGDSALGNIPEAIGKGLELSAVYRATDSLTFNGALGLLDTEITKVGAAQAAFLGQTLPRAPETTASFGAAYQGPDGFDASLDARYVSDHVSALEQTTLDSYVVVDIATGYEVELGSGTNLRVDAFISNLFDERYQTFSEATSFGGLNKVGAPRTIGVSATVSF